MSPNLNPARKFPGKVMGKEDEEQEEATMARNQSKKKIVIEIPSYKEVIESSQPRPTQSQQSSLFKPSQTFSQAFSFIKNSEFYTPPPPPPPPSSSNPGNLPENSTPRQIGENSTNVAASSSSQATQNRNAILVSHRQKGNPLLKHIRNVRWAFADVVCDYLLGQNACALYISLRYHLLHPDYLYFRIRELQKNYKLRVVLCHVDVEDVVKPLLEITKTSLLHDCTLLCAWSLEECGRYLETIKMYENKPADLIKGQMDTDYLSRLNHALTAVRHINKTDVVTLGSTFGSLSNVMDASMEDLARCPGIGERKVKCLYDTFHEPFKRVISSHWVSPETPVQKGIDTPSVNESVETEKETEDASKRRKKEPELTVKSALSVAFAKYADKYAKNGELKKDEVGETSDAVEPEAEEPAT